MAQNENLVFGVNPVLEKIRASSADILEILISDGSDRVALRRIGQEAARLGLRVVTVQRKVLDRLVEGQRHQGVVAKVAAYRYLPFEELLQRDIGNHGFGMDLDTRRLDRSAEFWRLVAQRGQRSEFAMSSFQKIDPLRSLQWR